MEICLHSLNLSNNSGSVEMWKCGNVEICLHCLNLSNNSGSVEMWKYVFIVLIYLITLEVWKCGNMSSMSLSNNSGICGQAVS